MGSDKLVAWTGAEKEGVGVRKNWLFFIFFTVVPQIHLDSERQEQKYLIGLLSGKGESARIGRPDGQVIRIGTESATVQGVDEQSDLKLKLLGMTRHPQEPYVHRARDIFNTKSHS